MKKKLKTHEKILKTAQKIFAYFGIKKQQ